MDETKVKSDTVEDDRLKNKPKGPKNNLVCHPTVLGYSSPQQSPKTT